MVATRSSTSLAFGICASCHLSRLPQWLSRGPSFDGPRHNYLPISTFCNLAQPTFCEAALTRQTGPDRTKSCGSKMRMSSLSKVEMSS